jgi:anhydro-N-acetylmuramic acid kinase
MPEKYHVIGLMSGTSLDGLDIAFVEFTKDDLGWHYKIIQAASQNYDATWRQQLVAAIHLDQSALAKLDRRYGEWLGLEVKNFVEQHKLKVDFVASHGHTVFHEPDKGITRQIGHGQVLADRSGLTTICDFRSADVALGGQGAPLVPIGDKMLFAEYVACLNLGGIANVSYEQDSHRLAFDIGMANLPLNHYARQLGHAFDENGRMSANGNVNQHLLAALNGLSYYQQGPPKSLGLEWFINEMQPVIESFNLIEEDVLATLVEHEAYQVATVLNALGKPGNILVTGGGAFNQHFLTRLNHHLKQDLDLELPTEELIEYKEALIFALMGVLRQRNEINCLKSVTGASKDSSTGELFYPRST